MNWISVKDQNPKLTEPGSKEKHYVLAVDKKGRMSVGWAYQYSSGRISWTFAKPIGEPTHWMQLPEPPQDL